MFSTVFNGNQIFILNDAWNSENDFKLDGSMIRDDQQSLTKREGRRPYSETITCKCQYQAVLKDASVRAAFGSLRQLNTQKVIIPLWPAISYWQNRAASAVTGGLMLVFKQDWSQYALYTPGNEPGWPLPTDLWTPALMGFIKPTQPSALTPDAATWDIDFTESSPNAYALSFTAAAPAAGPQPAGYAAAPKLLPFQPDWLRIDEGISVEVKREQIGFSRQASETFYPHTPWRTQNAQYTLLDADVWGMFKFFVKFMAPGASFWAPGWLELARLTANANAGATVLQVEDTNSVEIGDYLAFYSGSQIVGTGKVTATGPTSLTIDTPLPSILNPLSSLINQLCLARLAKPVISMTWSRPGVAQCDLQWDEMPPEYVPAADETLGVTLGGLLKRVVLIQLIRDLLNGTVLNYYFTNYERDINGLGQAWLSNSGVNGTMPTWDCGDVTKTVNLEQDTFDITTFVFPGNPVLDDVALRAETPLSVIVKFADYDGVNLTNIQTVFSGDAQKFSRKGNKITIKCSFGPSLFETQLPRMVRGAICNHIGGSNNDGSFLISAGCTLLKADWKFTGLVIGGISSAFPFTLNLGTLTGVGASAAAAAAVPGEVFANFFANGWVEWSAGGVGANIQRRGITASTLPTLGNTIALTLHRYFSAVPNAGDLVTFFPGCDGLFTTCQAFNSATNPTGKFNNYVNFGGEPFTPTVNPSTAGQPSLNTQGAKK